MSTRTTLFAALCGCLITTVVACVGVDDETIREDAVQIDADEPGAGELVAGAKHDERALEDAVEGASCQDAPQGLAPDVDTSNSLNHCCFKCQLSGEAWHTAPFTGQHCKVVADNRCWTWWLGNGKEAYQCAG
jgi:hypothetical protein